MNLDWVSKGGREMHDTAREAGRLFFEQYSDHAFRSILDVGSLDVNGSLREFSPQEATYVGVDLQSGPGVDVVLSSSTSFPFRDASFDVVVSTSCFEHDPLFWATFLEIFRVVKLEGYVYINAPSNGDYHRYPLDCWRFYPDAGLALEIWGRHNQVPVTLVESFVCRRNAVQWNDYVMVFCKSIVTNNERQRFISDRLSSAENIRKVGFGELLRRVRAPEDQRIIAALRKQLSDANAV